MSDYFWDEKSGRYRGPNGRYLNETEVRRALDSAIDAGNLRNARLAARLRSGQIDAITWENEMRQSIKAQHMYAVALARGGWKNMRPEDYGRAGGVIRRQYAYLNRFGEAIRSGKLPLTSGQINNRSIMYSEAARATFHRSDRLEKLSRGMSEERNLLGPADHCDDCQDMRALGWVPIGTLIPIGRRQCMVRCRCTIQYRAQDPAKPPPEEKSVMLWAMAELAMSAIGGTVPLSLGYVGRRVRRAYRTPDAAYKTIIRENVQASKLPDGPKQSILGALETAGKPIDWKATLDVAERTAASKFDVPTRGLPLTTNFERVVQRRYDYFEEFPLLGERWVEQATADFRFLLARTDEELLKIGQAMLMARYRSMAHPSTYQDFEQRMKKVNPLTRTETMVAELRTLQRKIEATVIESEIVKISRFDEKGNLAGLLIAEPGIGNQYGKLLWLRVRESQRGKGIGTDFFRTLEREGINPLTLQTQVDEIMSFRQAYGQRYLGLKEFPVETISLGYSNETIHRGLMRIIEDAKAKRITDIEHLIDMLTEIMDAPGLGWDVYQQDWSFIQERMVVLRAGHMRDTGWSGVADWKGRIYLSNETTENLERWLKSLNDGVVPDYSMPWDGLRTLIHELEHMRSPTRYTGFSSDGLSYGKSRVFSMIEEGIVERTARRRVQQLIRESPVWDPEFKVSKIWGASYQREVEFMDWYAVRFGETALDEVWNQKTGISRANLMGRKLQKDLIDDITGMATQFEQVRDHLIEFVGHMSPAEVVDFLFEGKKYLWLNPGESAPMGWVPALSHRTPRALDLLRDAEQKMTAGSIHRAVELVETVPIGVIASGRRAAKGSTADLQNYRISGKEHIDSIRETFVREQLALRGYSPDDIQRMWMSMDDAMVSWLGSSSTDQAALIKLGIERAFNARTSFHQVILDKNEYQNRFRKAIIDPIFSGQTVYLKHADETLSWAKTQQTSQQRGMFPRPIGEILEDIRFRSEAELQDFVELEHIFHRAIWIKTFGKENRKWRLFRGTNELIDDQIRMMGGDPSESTRRVLEGKLLGNSLSSWSPSHVRAGTFGKYGYMVAGNFGIDDVYSSFLTNRFMRNQELEVLVVGGRRIPDGGLLSHNVVAGLDPLSWFNRNKVFSSLKDFSNDIVRGSVNPVELEKWLDSVIDYKNFIFNFSSDYLRPKAQERFAQLENYLSSIKNVKLTNEQSLQLYTVWAQEIRKGAIGFVDIHIGFVNGKFELLKSWTKTGIEGLYNEVVINSRVGMASHFLNLDTSSFTIRRNIGGSTSPTWDEYLHWYNPMKPLQLALIAKDPTVLKSVNRLWGQHEKRIFLEKFDQFEKEMIDFTYKEMAEGRARVLLAQAKENLSQAVSNNPQLSLRMEIAERTFRETLRKGVIDPLGFAISFYKTNKLRVIGELNPIVSPTFPFMGWGPSFTFQNQLRQYNRDFDASSVVHTVNQMNYSDLIGRWITGKRMEFLLTNKQFQQDFPNWLPGIKEEFSEAQINDFLRSFKRFDEAFITRTWNLKKQDPHFVSQLAKNLPPDSSIPSASIASIQGPMSRVMDTSLERSVYEATRRELKSSIEAEVGSGRYLPVSQSYRTAFDAGVTNIESSTRAYLDMASERFMLVRRERLRLEFEKHLHRIPENLRQEIEATLYDFDVAKIVF